MSHALMEIDLSNERDNTSKNIGINDFVNSSMSGLPSITPVTNDFSVVGGGMQAASGLNLFENIGIFHLLLSFFLSYFFLLSFSSIILVIIIKGASIPFAFSNNTEWSHF